MAYSHPAARPSTDTRAERKKTSQRGIVCYEISVAGRVKAEYKKHERRKNANGALSNPRVISLKKSNEQKRKHKAAQKSECGSARCGKNERECLQQERGAIQPLESRFQTMPTDEKKGEKNVEKHVAGKIRRVAERAVKAHAPLINHNFPGKLQQAVDAEERRNANGGGKEAVPEALGVQDRGRYKKIRA